MRKFHRWFGLIVAAFLAVIAVTGVILQVQLLAEEPKGPRPELTAQQHQQPADAAAARSDSPPSGGRDHDGPPDENGGLHQTIMHIHSGEFLGKFANVIGLVCGLALFFFSVSGLWMYWQMFDARAKNGRHQIFWK